MSSPAEPLAARSLRHARQFVRFGLVGGSGIVVNLAVTVVLKWLVPHYQAVAIDLPGTAFNIRWYHVIAVLAFVVANTWNYELNRRWTFAARGRGTSQWWRGLANFMGIGAVALVAGLVIQTALLKPESAFYLEKYFGWMDDSNGLRTKLYWATLLQIALTMPINFVVNKLWTFRGGHRPEAPPVADLPAQANLEAPRRSA